MNAARIVVRDGVGDANVQLVNRAILGQRSQLFFNAFNAAFHEAVLPRLAWLAGAKLDAEARAGHGMPLAHIFTATVTMQDGRAGVRAQCLNERDVGQTAAVVRAELPA